MAHSASEALRIYTALHLMGDARPGQLVLTPGLDSIGCSLAVAAVARGAAVLAIESDPELIRQAIYAGYCDFAVSTADEALRILKNEIRQSRPVGVALAGDPAELLPTLHRRGVLPDLLLFATARGWASYPPAFARRCAFWRDRTDANSSRSPVQCEDLRGGLYARFSKFQVVEIDRPAARERPALMEGWRSDLRDEPELLLCTKAWVERSAQLMPRAMFAAVWQKRA